MSTSATGKRYIDLPGVTLNETAVPPALTPILGVVAEWAYVGDAALERKVRVTANKDIRTVVESARSLREEIYRFAFESPGTKAVPVPDEVVVFQMFWTSLQTLEAEIRNEK